METTTKDCIACFKQFKVRKDALHKKGFPHPPSDPKAASVSLFVRINNRPPECFTNGSYALWHTICASCGKKFAEAARDPIVADALVNILGWYVRQGIELKKAVNKIKSEVL